MAGSEIYRIIALGDSITEGTYGGADEGQTWPFLVQSMLESKGLQTEIINRGIPGETAPQGLLRFTRHVVDQQPRMVLVMYGANDSFIAYGYQKPMVTLAQFSQSMEQMMLMAAENNILPVLMTTTPFSSVTYPDGEIQHAGEQNKILDQYMDRVRELAAANRAALIDHFRLWLENDREATGIAEFIPDGVHPNVEGNRLIAKTVFDALVKIIQHDKII
jgi:lysophospholipase L1-like esterase